MTHNNSRTAPPHPDWLRQRAEACDVYAFGSTALHGLHARIRPFGRFDQDYWYVVFFPASRGREPFYTLNHAQYGQVVAESFDLPADWKPSDWRNVYG